MSKILFQIVFVSILFFATPAQAMWGGWPDGCGHKGQETCLGPLHTGCKGKLEKCDMPHYKRDVCKKKGHCPKDSRNKTGCPECGHGGQKPCVAKGVCHMCIKHHHVSVKTGNCTKTKSLKTILENSNKELTGYEKKCRKGLQKFEKKLDKGTRKSLENLLHGKKLEKELLDTALHSVKMEEVCMEETFNGASCGLIGWVKSYNNLALYLIKEHTIDTKGIAKSVLEQGEKYTENLLHNKTCKDNGNSFGRSLCAAMETIADDARQPVQCITATIKDASHLKKRKSKKKKASEKEVIKFTRNACYQVSRLGVGIAADQAVSLLTAGIGEVVELPKDVRAIVSAAKKLAKAKVMLEKVLNEGEKAKDMLDKSEIHSVMEKHESCKPLLKFLD